ncbi:hypothetical protein [Gordonia soli]|nr:hypothetical protein [Gordonia soli]
MDTTPESVRDLSRPLALRQLIEIEEGVVIPGFAAIADDPGLFAVTGEQSSAVDAALDRHLDRVLAVKQLLVDALRGQAVEPDVLEDVPLALPVRAVESVLAHPRRVRDAGMQAVVRTAFLVAAVHSLDQIPDPGAEGLRLSERELLRDILSQALPGLVGDNRAALGLYIGKASIFLTEADEVRWTAVDETPRGPRPESLLNYDAIALRQTCKAIGLGPGSYRLAAMDR